MNEDCILQAITTTDDQTKMDCIKEIRGMERLISTRAVFHGGLSEQVEDLQLQILKFRELEYSMRYGDYFGLPLTSLRYKFELHETPGHEHLSGRYSWSEIAERIRQERRAEAQWSKLTRAEKRVNPEPESPTTVAVFATCQSLGFDPHQMLWAIERYADRNMTVHADIMEMIKKGQWIVLGVVVYRDLQEIHCLLPEGCNDDTEHLTAILEELLDT
ncbi:hypothetical protein MMC30_007706 [Trapelia coarctata]|nr:hypothetical protein [Trapelia coarctata]